MTRLRFLLRRLTDAAGDDRGFAMVAVIGVMAITGLFLAAGFAAADGDLPVVQNSKDRKRAYAAAEAGLEYYRYQLVQDNDYWTHCDNVPGPAPGVPAPITQAGAANRNWRTLPGSDAQYTVELLPAKGFTSCVEGNESTMLDKATGTFRIRATGRAGDVTRSIVATFRRASFLDYLYFTDFETTDPAAYATPAQRATADSVCANKYRADRPAGACQEIQFREPDALNGPFHTNDDILTCDRPSFGRDDNDVVEVSGPAPGYHPACSNVPPTFKGIFKYEQKPLTMPSSNRELKTVTGADRYVGRTTIRLNGAGYTATLSDGSTVTKAIPNAGVIYVDNGPNCTGKVPPVIATYSESRDCAVVYVSGTYSKSLTIGSAGDIVIRPPANASDSNGDIIHTNDAILGLIAQEFIRYYHPVTNSVWAGASRGCDNAGGPNPYMRTVRIDAAMLALDHSITTDNFNCGSRLDNLTINGALAQPYRGTVGATGTDPRTGRANQSGFIKDYNYDDRLRFRSPPYFLTPVDAAWKVIRTNEQVPAAG
jgi:hypothetical protein